ncbi:MAG: hypothetical protein KAY22_22840 [Rhizorhabdus sp.]|uniref:GcrA family cell cycle regulator n=1 Tax=Rhizorhabdus sp. TaxID=1968843 RepID=UPI001B6920B0|nr:GcrA family cell cycle regulator [Rhizorhabdus sp.]MBP8235139.1 hypothetical protein [Rhizorhabdus sp.]
MVDWNIRDETGLTLLERAIHLRRARRSTREIAAILGNGLTRNAVIGKLDRHREEIEPIPRREKSHRPPMPLIRKPPPPAPPPFVRPVPMIEARTPEGPTAPATILIERDGKLYANNALKPDVCRWPIGDPRDSNFHFCGKKAVPLKPYCPECTKRAFRTVDDAKVEARATRSKQLEPT